LGTTGSPGRDWRVGEDAGAVATVYFGVITIMVKCGWLLTLRNVFIADGMVDVIAVRLAVDGASIPTLRFACP